MDGFGEFDEFIFLVMTGKLGKDYTSRGNPLDLVLGSLLSDLTRVDPLYDFFMFAPYSSWFRGKRVSFSIHSFPTDHRQKRCNHAAWLPALCRGPVRT